VFFLVEGTARSVAFSPRLPSGVQTLQRLPPGAVLGLTGLASGRGWETLMASTELVLVAVPQEALREAMAASPALGQRMRASVAPEELFGVLRSCAVYVQGRGLAASAGESHAVGNRERTSGNGGGVLAGRMPSNENWFIECGARSGGAFSRGGEHGDGDGEDGGLCDLGALEGFGWAGGHQLAERLAQCGLSLCQHGACGRGGCEGGGTHADALRALSREDPRGDRRHAANPSRPICPPR
jgi:hypothetical protein